MVTAAAGRRVQIARTPAQAIAAHVGTHVRRQCTVIGPTVNIASRLSSVADVGQIVASEAIIEAYEERALSRSARDLTGAACY